MLDWIRSRLARQPSDPTALHSELQGLRLELKARDERIARLAEELERQRSAARAHASNAAQAQLEQLLDDVAAPVAQLLTQAHLLETEGRPVPAKDVLAVARRLVRALEDHGLVQEGVLGQTVPFDPDRHQSLGGAALLGPGEPVVLRFVGLAYGGRLLSKAGVERVER